MRAIRSTYIIDDDPLFIFGMKLILNEIGSFGDLNICLNGQEALNALNTSIEGGGVLPDVIFLDLNMPVMDGWEFLNHFMNFPLEIRKDIYVYIVSSSIDPRDLEKIKTIDAINKYILKPVTIEDLTQVRSEVA